MPGPEGWLHVQNRLLRWFEDGIETTQDRHWKDHVPVLTTHLEVAQDVVRNPPNEVSDPIEISVTHTVFTLQKSRLNSAADTPV
jgi:hypothetical protein